MKKKKPISVQEALHALLKDKKVMQRIFNEMQADQAKKDAITDKWKRKFDKMDDKTFTKYVKMICKDYNENPYTKKEKPFKFVKEMWGIVDVIQKYGTEAEFPKDENKYGFGHGCWNFRGFDMVLYCGQGSFYAICHNGVRIGQTWN